jgi:hypothetical protein
VVVALPSSEDIEPEVSIAPRTVLKVSVVDFSP